MERAGAGHHLSGESGSIRSWLPSRGDPSVTMVVSVTALMSLKSRLALSRLALFVEPEDATGDRLAPFIQAGVDLVVLESSDDGDADAQRVVALRQVMAQLPILLATANGDAAEAASADVVHLERPGWWIFGSRPRGHQWSLLGRNARDRRTVRNPGDEFDYLFVGPVAGGVESRLVAEAVEHQPPLTTDAVPWFALVEDDFPVVESLIDVGVRRIALGSGLMRDPDGAAWLAGLRQRLDQVWRDEPGGLDFSRSAARL